MAADNGDANKGKILGTSQIVLTLDRAHFLLSIGGNTENYDEALAMIEMARRAFEDKIRAASMSRVLTAPASMPFDFTKRQ